MGNSAAAEAPWGRHDDVKRLVEALEGPNRWVLLLGPVGVGKSTLLRAASRAASRVTRRRQVWLDARANSGAWWAHVADALGVGHGTEDPMATLALVAESLENTPTLLLMDDVDRLEPLARQGVAALVDACASLHVWSTARERLHLGEWVAPVAPLNEDTAARLFADRFNRASGGAPLPDDLARHIARLTDGLPLAIELVASRAAALGTQAVLQALQQPTRLVWSLGGLAREVEAGLAVLPSEARRLCMAMAVFARPMDVSALAAVFLDNANAVTVHEPLQRLVDASLVRRLDGEGQPRFELLAIVRAVAEAQLQQNVALHTELGSRHAAYWTRWAAIAADAPNPVADTVSCLDDLWLAWKHNPDAAGASTLALVMARWLIMHGPVATYADLMAHALPAARREGPASAAPLLLEEARRLAFRGHHMPARVLCEEALAAATRIGARALQSRAASLLCYCARALGDDGMARSAGQDALAWATAEQAPALMAMAHNMLGLLEYAQGRSAAAQEHHQRALAEARSPRLSRIMAIALANLCDDALQVGDLKEAAWAIAESTRAFAEAGDRRHMAYTASQRAAVMRLQGKPQEAHAELMSSLPLLEVLDDIEGQAMAYVELAQLALVAGDAAQALRHWQQAHAIAYRSDDRVLHAAVERQRPLPNTHAVVPAAPRPLLRVDATRAILPDGRQLDLARRGPLKRVLHALVRQHSLNPGAVLPPAQLVEAGWPGERMLHESGLARVYMAIRRLRAMGFETLIRTRDGGYHLDEHVDVQNHL